MPLQGVVWCAVTRRVAAGWLVLPFQGEGKTYHPFNENSTKILQITIILIFQQHSAETYRLNTF
ncbi:MAG: hypothetical protein LBL62_08475 [Planctomycetaceae bacterium]|nr:hypothetical protein [Planctomycetaceae bacterium]